MHPLRLQQRDIFAWVYRHREVRQVALDEAAD